MSEKEYKARCESLFAKNTVLLNQQKIDAEQIRALQKQNGELTDKVKELEQKLIEADNATDVFNAQEKRIAELTDELKLINNECKDMREELKQRIMENQKLCEQVEKMKKYGKLLQDICVVLGNDNFMVAVQLESAVKKLWDASEEKEGLKMVEDIENRLLEIKPQEWAEITKWEIKEK